MAPNRALPKLSLQPWTKDLVVLLAVSVPFTFAGIGSFDFLDPDEGMYASIASEMANGDWIIPHFNGFPYLEKPPLFFWLAALTQRLVHSAEWTVRLWSMLPALGTVLLTWAMGRSLYGRESGLLAGLTLATTAGYVLYVRRASTDFLLVFSLTLALYGFLRDLDGGRAGTARFLLFYLGAALGVLTKGLIGVVFPVAIAGLTLVWHRGVNLKQLNLARGLMLFALVALPWHVAAWWRSPGLLEFYLVDNQILRFLNLRSFIDPDVPLSTFQFMAVSFIWFFPWSFFVFARTQPAGTKSGPRALIIFWVVVVLGFFAVSRSKLEFYALPAFPALSLLVGAAWSSGRDIGRWLWLGSAGVLATGIWLMNLGSGLSPEKLLNILAKLNAYYRILQQQELPLPLPSSDPWGHLMQELGAILVFGWIAATLCWSLGRHRTAFFSMVVMSAAIALVILRILATVEPYHSVKSVSAAIQEHATEEDLIVIEGPLQHSAGLPFYTRRRITILNGTAGDLDFASRLAEARGWFLNTQDFLRLWDGPRRVLFVTQQPATGVMRRVSPREAQLLGRFGSRFLYSNH